MRSEAREKGGEEEESERREEKKKRAREGRRRRRERACRRDENTSNGRLSISLFCRFRNAFFRFVFALSKQPARNARHELLRRQDQPGRAHLAAR